MSERVKVGDNLLLVQPATRFRDRQETPVAVTKVGRKYFYVDAVDGSLRYITDRAKFNLENGWQVSDYSQDRCRVATPEMIAAEDERNEALRGLHKAGIRFDYGAERNLSTKRLQAALAALVGDDE